jgi:hypothetical protein
MFRVNDTAYAEDGSAGIDSNPATAAKYIGADITHQTATDYFGTNDRVAMDANINADYQNPRVDGLGNDFPGNPRVRWGIGGFMGGLRTPGNGAATKDATQQLDETPAGVQPWEIGGPMGPGVIQEGDEQNQWYDTLRPQAGYPLALQSDVDEANSTGVHSPNLSVTSDGYLNTPGYGRLLIPEKPVQVADRESRHPAEITSTRPWDVLMGAWPFTGLKTAMQRPVAATPLTFDSPLVNALPSPTGTQGADIPNTPNYNPYALTFRAPPEPWDTANNGQYVDSGQ